MANIMHLLLCVRLMNQIRTETWAGLTSMHPCNLSRIRNCRKFILYAYMHFPNLLASLLCYVRNGLCSIHQPLLLFLLPSWAGPWCPVILAGSPGSPCAQKLYSWETGYPAPETSQLLIALVVKAHFWPGFTISAFTLWCAFSLWDCTAETKVRTTLYSTAEKASCESPISTELCQSCSSTCLSSSPHHLPPSLCPVNVAMLPWFSALLQMRFLSPLLKPFSRRSAKSSTCSISGSEAALEPLGGSLSFFLPYRVLNISYSMLPFLFPLSQRHRLSFCNPLPLVSCSLHRIIE